MVGNHVVSGRSVEAKGRTIEVAIESALARLGRPRNQVEVKVLREASRGLLGFGAQDAIVRVKEIVPAPVQSDSDLPTVSKSNHIKRSVEPDEPHKSEEAEAGLATIKEELNGTLAPYSEELLTMSREVLLDILERMNVIADVFATWSAPEDEQDEPALLLNIIGDDLGLLIGRGGETLRNLQYILRLIIVRRIGKWINVIVDVEGYKQRRQNIVRQLARRVANRVMATGRVAHMDPMNSYERRIVHLELSKIEGITTKSSGEGKHRRVGVYPA